MKQWVGCFQALALSCTLAVLFDSTAVRGESEVPRLDVYRMLQYDQGEQHFGSRKAAMNMLAVPDTLSGEASRNVVVVEWHKMTEGKLQELLGYKRAAGLLIILPAEGVPLDPQQEELWRQVEYNLITRDVPVPVYFTFDGDQAAQLKAAVEPNAGDTQLVVSAKQNPTKATNIQASNYQAFLEGTGEAGSTDPPKIVAVVANVDSLGVAPDLAMGADSNGSGMAAVLQLARMFHRLYSSSRMQGKYSMLFVLTGAGRMDYAGTKHWLSSTDPRVLDNIDFALCLDSIGGLFSDPAVADPTLYVHSSKPAKDPALTRLISVLNASSTAQGVSLQLVHKKINISDTVVSWEHEQFSRKRILAVTLSRHPSHAPHLRSSVLDRTVDKTALKKNVEIVANALARVVFDLESTYSIFSGSYGVNVPFLEAWVDMAGREGRMAAHAAVAAKDKDKGTSLLDKAEQVLKEISSEDNKQTFTLDQTRVFYVGGTSTTLSVYTVRPLSFDLAMTVAVLAYLLALLILLQGTQEAMKTLSEIVFKGKGRRQKRP